jgi:hypothetical protein
MYAGFVVKDAQYEMSFRSKAQGESEPEKPFAEPRVEIDFDVDFSNSLHFITSSRATTRLGIINSNTCTKLGD